MHGEQLKYRKSRKQPISRRRYLNDESGDDVDDAKVVQRRYIKPAKFDGSGSFETFMAQFNNCAEYNNWNSIDRLAHLKACLIGDAGQVLWDSSPEATNTLRKLTELLKNRFSGSQQSDKYRMELRLRRRRNGETLSVLHRDVRRLMALAHPDLPHSARETIACDYFVDSLNDADFALKVRQRNPGTLDEALRISLQLEAWQQDADRLRLEESGRQRLKQVRGAVAEVQCPGEAFVRQSDLQARLDRMESGFHQCLNEVLQSCKSSNRSKFSSENCVPARPNEVQSSKGDRSRWKNSKSQGN